MFCQQKCGKISIFVSSDKNSEKGTLRAIILHMENTALRGLPHIPFSRRGLPHIFFSTRSAPRDHPRFFAKQSDAKPRAVLSVLRTRAPSYHALRLDISGSGLLFTVHAPSYRRPSVSLLPAACGAVTLPALYPAARSDVGKA